MSDLGSRLARELRSYPPAGASEVASWRARYQPFVARTIAQPSRPSRPLLSVVIVAWRTPEMIMSCIDAIRAQQGLKASELEIILVNNGGLEKVEHLFASAVDLELRMALNVDLCPARNAGAAWARGEVLAFVDDDGLVAREHAQRALAHMRADANIVALRGKIVARAHPYFTTLAGHYDRGSALVDDALVTEGNAYVRREAYLDAGGFHERMRGHEGIDLGFRLQRQQPSWRIVYAPDVIMAHDYIDSWGKFWRKFSSYASIDEGEAARDGERAAYLAHQLGRTFPPPHRPLDERLARHALSVARDAVRGWARLTQRGLPRGHGR